MEIMKKERTLVLIKPDAVVRNLIGKIITRFEEVGLKILGMKMIWTDEELAKKHYTEEIVKKHGERVRRELITFLIESPVVALVLEGVDAVKIAKKMTGTTYPSESPPGTIRGDFAHISMDYANTNEIIVRNLVHASGSKDDAKSEITLWFKPEELHTYKTIHDIVCFKE